MLVVQFRDIGEEEEWFSSETIVFFFSEAEHRILVELGVADPITCFFVFSPATLA